MKFGMFFWVALSNMAQNKLRTSLTLLGLVIGISSVLLMTGLGRGFQQTNEEMMAGMLPNKVTVSSGFSMTGPVKPLTLRDAQLLRALVGSSALTAVAPTTWLGDLDIKGFDRETGMYPQLTATTSDYALTANLNFAQGRFFTPEEEAADELVIVVNQAFLDAIPGGATAANSVTIANRRFTVTGIIDDSNMFGGYSYPTAYLSLSLFPFPLYSQSIALEQGAPVVNEISVLTTDVASIAQAQKEIEMLLRLAHGLDSRQENDFYISANGDFVEIMQDSNRIFTLVLGGIGAISLIVGGIGIMNIMLANISERTREIGIRKAVGARNRDILLQFLIEAIVICLAGAFLGVALSYGLGSLVSTQMQGGGMGGLRIVIDSQSVMIASLCGIGAGVIFGLYPAIRAMQLNPIQALQTD